MVRYSEGSGLMLSYKIVKNIFQNIAKSINVTKFNAAIKQLNFETSNIILFI